MSTSFSNITSRVRPGIAALPLGGLLYIIGFLFRGQPIPTNNPALFAEIVTAPTYLIGWVILIMATVTVIFGCMALYGHLSGMTVETSAFAALILSVTGFALQIGFYTVISFVAIAAGKLYLAGQPAVMNLFAGLFGGDGGFGIYLALATLCVLSGLVLFAVAIARSANLPTWAGILLPVFQLCLLAPAFQLRGTGSLVVELTGSVLLVVAGLALTRAIRSGE